MRKSDASCRINGVQVTKMLVTPTGLQAQWDLVRTPVGKEEKGSPDMIFGSCTATKGWPKGVLKLVDELKTAVEEHVAGVLFEEGEDYVRDSDTERPIGLVQHEESADLGSLAGDGTEQL